MQKRTLTTEEQHIETTAIAQFVNQARSLTPDQRQQVVARMRRFAKPESEWGERPVSKGHKMSVAGVQETIRQIEEL